MTTRFINDPIVESAVKVLPYYRKIQEAFVNKKGTISQPSDVTKVVRTVISDSSVIFKTVRDKVVDNNMVIIGGLYDPNEDEEQFPAITISLHFNPDQKNIAVKDINVPFIAREICDTLMHELCHQRQYRSRGFAIPSKGFKSNRKDGIVQAEQEYLGSPDEIEAYGCTIASEIFLMNGFSVPEKVHSAIKNCHEYQLYQKTFGPTHSVVSSVKSYAVLYLEKFKEAF